MRSFSVQFNWCLSHQVSWCLNSLAESLDTGALVEVSQCPGGRNHYKQQVIMAKSSFPSTFWWLNEDLLLSMSFNLPNNKKRKNIQKNTLIFNLTSFLSLHFAFSTKTTHHTTKPTPKNTHKKVSRCLKADFTPSMPFSVSGSFFANLGDQQTMEHMQVAPRPQTMACWFAASWNYKNQNLCRSLELEFRSTWPLQHLYDSSTTRHHIVKGQILFFLTELGHVDLLSQVWSMSCIYIFVYIWIYI